MEVESHTRSCEQCQTRLTSLREVQSLVSRLPAAEPPRSFALSPAMAAPAPAQRPAGRRSTFALAPAAALTVFLALIAVDLGGAGSRSADEAGTMAAAGGAAQEALTAKDASSSADAQPPSGRSAETFAAPATAPQPAQTPMMGGDSGPAQPLGTVGLPPPAIGSGVTSDAAAAPPAANTRDGAVGRGDSGIDWLRLAQIVTLLTFLVSAGLVFGPSLLKKRS